MFQNKSINEHLYNMGAGGGSFSEHNNEAESHKGRHESHHVNSKNLSPFRRSGTKSLSESDFIHIQARQGANILTMGRAHEPGRGKTNTFMKKEAKDTHTQLTKMTTKRKELYLTHHLKGTAKAVLRDQFQYATHPITSYLKVN